VGASAVGTGRGLKRSHGTGRWELGPWEPVQLELAVENGGGSWGSWDWSHGRGSENPAAVGTRLVGSGAIHRNWSGGSYYAGWDWGALWELGQWESQSCGSGNQDGRNWKTVVRGWEVGGRGLSDWVGSSCRVVRLGVSSRRVDWSSGRPRVGSGQVGSGRQVGSSGQVVGSGRRVRSSERVGLSGRVVGLSRQVIGSGCKVGSSCQVGSHSSGRVVRSGRQVGSAGRVVGSGRKVVSSRCRVESSRVWLGWVIGSGRVVGSSHLRSWSGCRSGRVVGFIIYLTKSIFYKFLWPQCHHFYKTEKFAPRQESGRWVGLSCRVTGHQVRSSDQVGSSRQVIRSGWIIVPSHWVVSPSRWVVRSGRRARLSDPVGSSRPVVRSGRLAEWSGRVRRVAESSVVSPSRWVVRSGLVISPRRRVVSPSHRVGSSRQVVRSGWVVVSPSRRVGSSRRVVRSGCFGVISPSRRVVSPSHQVVGLSDRVGSSCRVVRSVGSSHRVVGSSVRPRVGWSCRQRRG
jgi:hypothetical protein